MNRFVVRTVSESSIYIEFLVELQKILDCSCIVWMANKLFHWNWKFSFQTNKFNLLCLISIRSRFTLINAKRRINENKLNDREDNLYSWKFFYYFYSAYPWSASMLDHDNKKQDILTNVFWKLKDYWSEFWKYTLNVANVSVFPIISVVSMTLTLSRQYASQFSNRLTS